MNEVNEEMLKLKKVLNETMHDGQSLLCNTSYICEIN